VISRLADSRTQPTEARLPYFGDSARSLKTPGAGLIVVVRQAPEPGVRYADVNAPEAARNLACRMANTGIE
jgi:hypothetical protein